MILTGGFIAMELQGTNLKYINRISMTRITYLIIGIIMSVNAVRDFLIGSVALTNQTRVDGTQIASSFGSVDLRRDVCQQLANGVPCPTGIDSD